MSRIKHLTMLIMKLVFIVICFIASAVMTSLMEYRTDEIRIGDGITEKDILVFDSDFESTGASLSYEISDGDIIFDIVQSGERYDDIAVLITYPPAVYDTTYLRDMLGKRADKEQEYLTAMENGPWYGNIDFALKSDKTFSTDRSGFTFTDPDLNDYSEPVFVKAANKSNITADFKLTKDERVDVYLIFGSSEYGALPSGRYTLSADLNIVGHYDEAYAAPTLSAFERMGTIMRVSARAVKEAGLGIFRPSSWLTFYGLMAVLGWFIYLYRDARVVISIFLAVLSDNWSGAGTIVYNVYRNGVHVGTYADDTGNFAKLAIALIVAMISWFVLTVTIPLRILWYLIRDIIYLFAEDDEALDEFSYLGNLLGSIGIYLALFGFAGIMGAGMVVGIISLVVGIVLVVIGTKLCKECEDYV